MYAYYILHMWSRSSGGRWRFREVDAAFAKRFHSSRFDESNLIQVQMKRFILRLVALASF